MKDKPIYAIEDSFPVVEINRLAVPERNAFKPIYQMHKWFARRASCVFRAILLGCMKPLPLDENGKPVKSGAEVIMEEFYKDHTNDPDTNGKIILDPFMGGGTTIVEALRLGCKVIGIDLNPVAWFIVKTEVEPVEIDKLGYAFKRLEERPVHWSGKPLKETLLDQYKTECPCCGAGTEEADIIYTFWVKSAICTDSRCRKEVPLFSNYIIAHKEPSIRYHRDAVCTNCGKTFDWEIEPASLIAERNLIRVSGAYSAGIGRSTARWSYAPLPDGNGDPRAQCPWCHKEMIPKLHSNKRERKKVPLSILLCPHCESVCQWRGELPDEVSCPVCNKSYDPKSGNVPKSGAYQCSCGNRGKIIDSIRRLPEEKLLPMRPYAIEGYCKRCAGELEDDVAEMADDLFGKKRKQKKKKAPDHPCLLSKNKGKFFKRVNLKDLARYNRACETWEREKEYLPYPKQRIPWGEKTKSGLIAHHYHYWHQMFNPRQLLCLSTLLKAINEEPDQVLKEMLLSGFINLLNNMSDFTTYLLQRDCTRQVFARHDFAPKATSCESSVWGTEFGMGNYCSYYKTVLHGIKFGLKPSDRRSTRNINKKGGRILKDIPSNESHYNYAARPMLESMDSRRLDQLTNDSYIDLIITDPPYSDNVNYSELSDYFYVWLRLVLSRKYACFAPEETPKLEEIIENPTRGYRLADFEEGLKNVFTKSINSVRNDSLMAFTFHHSKGKTWDSLLNALCESGFLIASVYPIHGEPEASLHLQDKSSISYDLIHVCRKRTSSQNQNDKRSWAGIRQEIRRKAREEITAIEAGRYGNEPLAPPDVQIILIGKCLELYSRYYGSIVDHKGKEVTLKQALEEIRVMVDNLITKDKPLPSELNDIDAESYVYLTCLCGRKEIKSDEVHKTTRGIMEPDTLIKAGLITKGRAGRGRTYEVKQPLERFSSLQDKFNEYAPPSADLFGKVQEAKNKIHMIDYVHFLMGLIESGENTMPWIEKFRGNIPEIRAACEYMIGRNKSFAGTLKKILEYIDVGPLFKRSD